MTHVGISYDVAVTDSQSVVRRRRRRRSRSRHKSRHNAALDSAIFGVSQKLALLARLGRAGQYVLHHEALYDPDIDTRPHTRCHAPGAELAVSSVACCCCGRPLPGHGLVLSLDGGGQPPNLGELSFWEQTNAQLAAKMDQVQARCIRPQWTAAELQTIEALEQQPGHVFRTERVRREKRLANDKMTIFNMLFQFPKYGRAGQWVLHHLDLYHPAIDTRPQTRSAADAVLCDDVFNGEVRFMGAGDIPAALELVWGGPGPAPDPDDASFWQDTCKALSDKLFAVSQGRVQPQFAPKERRQLALLDADPGHAFSVYAAQSPNGDMGLPYTVTDAPAVAEKKKQLWIAMYRVVLAMDVLWDAGLPGKWVLHNQDIYLTAYDTRFRGIEPDCELAFDARSLTLVHKEGTALFQDSELGQLFYDPCLGSFSTQKQPNLESVAFWKQKLAHLQTRADDIAAGRLTEHGFSNGELMRIELLERTLQYQRGYAEGSDEPAGKASTHITGWLDNMASSFSAATTHAGPPSAGGGLSRECSEDAGSDKNGDCLAIADEDNHPTDACVAAPPVPRTTWSLRPRPTKAPITMAPDDSGPQTKKRVGFCLSKPKKKRHLEDTIVHKPTRKSPRLVNCLKRPWSTTY